MNAILEAWWRARTPREHTLIKAAGVLVFAVLLPLWALQAASTYRAEAAQSLQAAQALAADVRALTNDQGGPALPQNDGTPRGLAFAAAQALTLTVARVEPMGGDRVRIVFEPAASKPVFQWLDVMNRRGVLVARTQIVRVGEGDVVAAEFDLARN